FAVTLGIWIQSEACRITVLIIEVAAYGVQYDKGLLVRIQMALQGGEEYRIIANLGMQAGRVEKGDCGSLLSIAGNNAVMFTYCCLIGKPSCGIARIGCNADNRERGLWVWCAVWPDQWLCSQHGWHSLSGSCTLCQCIGKAEQVLAVRYASFQAWRSGWCLRVEPMPSIARGGLANHQHYHICGGCIILHAKG